MSSRKYGGGREGERERGTEREGEGQRERERERGEVTNLYEGLAGSRHIFVGGEESLRPADGHVRP